MNRRDTRKLADHIREDLRKVQVPWEALDALPALERPADALDMGGVTDDAVEEDERSRETGHREDDRR
jgi:hypothetical protein